MLLNHGHLVQVGGVSDHHLLNTAAFGHLENMQGLAQIKRHHLPAHAVKQVLAMLSQHGGQMIQLQIVSALGLTAEMVAERLHKMEAEGQIERRWSAEE